MNNWKWIVLGLALIAVCIPAINWLRVYEPIAIWLEGIALVAIFVLDSREYRKQGQERLKEEQERIDQHKETAAQMDIWRKQIHADRVAEIFRALRAFENFLVDSVHRNRSFGPGRDYSEFGNLGTHPYSKIFPAYLNLQEAYYLSYLVSDPLAAYMKERMAEADGLQRVKDPEEFHRRLAEFHKNWDVYKMAAKIRELS
jgi:hypothetical protein